MSTDLGPFSSTTKPMVFLIRDWNSLCDHGLEKAPAYIVRVNGSYYEAIKGGTTSGAGTIAYGGADNAGTVDGTDAYAVIQACLDAVTSGGQIYIKQGTYTIDSALEVTNNNTYIQMEPAAVLYSTNSTDGVTQDEGGTCYPAIYVNACNYFMLDGGYIDGGGAAALFTGIILIDTNYARISNLTITRMNDGSGIYFDSGNKKYTVTNVTINYNDTGDGNAGFDNFDNPNAEAQYVNCKVIGNEYLKYGWLISSCQEIDIIAPQVVSCVNNGIWFDSNADAPVGTRAPSNNSVVGGFINDITTYHGIRITSATGVRVIGVKITACDNAGAYGVYEDGTGADYNIIMDNDLRGNTTAAYVTGQNTICMNNTGRNPFGSIVNPFDTTNDLLVTSGGDSQSPEASTDYIICHAHAFISSPDSGNTDCAIVVKDQADNVMNQVAQSTLNGYFVPRGFKVNWGAFTGAAPEVYVAFV